MASQTSEGMYLRVQITPKNCTFRLPKVGTQHIETLDDLFETIGGGSKKQTTNSQTPKGTKTMISSDWYPIKSAREVANKCNCADLIYQKASTIDDVERARTSYAEFKKHASKVLNEYYEAGKNPDQAMADRINTKACMIFQVRVYIMKVDSNPIDGVNPGKDGLYRQSKIARTFYVEHQPQEEVLEHFALLLSEEGTNVTCDGTLILVRSDGTTPRSGRNAGSRKFQIISARDPGTINDQELTALVNHLLSMKT